MMESFFVNIKVLTLQCLGPWIPDWAEVLLSMKISMLAIAVLGPLTMMYLTLWERKIIARMQNRIGPNRVGKFGLLQPVADGIKMLTKENIVPQNADKWLHLLAPIAILVPSLLLFSVIPFGRKMTAVDLNVGLLFFIAISSTTTISIFMASWASRNKYSLLGGMRSVAQMISYEIPMVLSVVPVILIAGTLSTNSIVEAQGGFHGLNWFVWTPWGFAGFLMFFLCGTAEVNRSPFDLPEAESELVAGFHTEYSGMKFALFYMAEFMNCFTVSGLAAALFLGGWQGPSVLPSWLWFMIKTYLLIFVMFWFRGTLPRFRVDQLMGFAWKFLLPLSLINILTAGLWYYIPGSAMRFSVTALIVLISFWIFSKLNSNYTQEKRTYVLAE